MNNNLPFLSILVFLFCPITHAVSQTVVINEIVSSNDSHIDEDGDTPDWFELRNLSAEVVELTSWTVTDDRNLPTRWTFPEIILAPDGYLKIWASDKDRPGGGATRTLISPEDQFRYYLPSAPLGTDWRTNDFDDSSWEIGRAGFGYGDGDDYSLVPTNTPAIFIRKAFTIEDVNAIEAMFLDIDYDDAFVAFLNGTEIARANITGTFPAFNTQAITDREAQFYQGGLPERYFVNALDLLQAGENILSIQVHNVSTFSSDLSLIPWLTATFNSPTTAGSSPPGWMNVPEYCPHTNFKISAAGETLYLFNPQGVLMDSLNGAGIPGDRSKGRLPQQPSEIRLFTTTTPGTINPEEGFQGAIASNIVFSPSGGTFPNALTLDLSGVASPAEIRYTLDATLPDSNSQLYSTPITITNNTVIRAAIFRSGYLPSAVQTETYLIGAEHDLPIVSLVTAPDNFFDQTSGIYVLGDDYSPSLPYFGANFWEDWERPIHFSFYEPDGSLGTSFNAGVKIFGGWSRANEQRSLSIFARNIYGDGIIDYPFFPQLEYQEFEAIVLRNAGNDWLRSNFRDAVLTGLLQDADVETQAYRPCVAYLNGAYWGIYGLREKVNEHFLAAKYNLDPDELDILEMNGAVIQGSNLDYLNLLQFTQNNDLSSDANFAIIEQQIDVENYLLYQLSQIYFDNTDWPGNNIKYWRPPGGQWRWILFDTDFGFGTWNPFSYANNTLAHALASDGPGWPNPPWSTSLLRSLVNNTGFRNRFINRFADEMNSRFLPSRVIEHIDSLQANIANEIPRHYDRWSGDLVFWQNQVNTMRNFAQLRQISMKQHILNQFNLPAYHEFQLSNQTPERGSVQLNSLEIRQANWSGDYFEEVPIQLTALPAPGYSFSHWAGDLTATDAQVTLSLDAAFQLEAVFTEGDISATDPIADLRIFTFYPNPSAAGELNLSFTLAKAQPISISLYDQRGQMVRSLFRSYLNDGEQVLNYSLPSLPTGSYQLTICNEHGECWQQQWLKM